MQEIPNVSIPASAGSGIALRTQLEHQRNTGAQWFWAIAVLSLLNSLIIIAGMQWSFIVGLAITQLVDGVAAALAASVDPRPAAVFTIIAVMFDVGVVAMFGLFGWLARKGYIWSFYVGMALYGVDGLIFLVIGDWLSLGFHVFALWGMWRGCRALAQLKRVPA